MPSARTAKVFGYRGTSHILMLLASFFFVEPSTLMSEGSVTWDPKQHDFGEVAVGETAMHTFILRHQGDTPISGVVGLRGGEASFGPQQVISTNADGAMSVFAADLDGDGGLDVLSASYKDEKIAWYENQGGGSFGAQQVISTNAIGARSVYAADLDGDDGPDVLSASDRDDKIAWYKNLGGGSFGTQRVISTNADGAMSVHTADLDGDGDPDVLSASKDDDKIAWFENKGGGSFGSFSITAGGAFTLANGDTRKVTVIFAPTAATDYQCTLAAGTGNPEASISGDGNESIRDFFTFDELPQVPRLLNVPPIRFPKELSRRGVEQGKVMVKIKIDPDGRASLIKIESFSHRELLPAAKKIIRRARFSRPNIDGQARTAVGIWPMVIKDHK